MVVPLILGAIMNSFTPQALQVGGFTTAIVKGSSAFNRRISCMYGCRDQF